MDQKIVMPKIEEKLFYKSTYGSGEHGEWKRINRLLYKVIWYFWFNDLRSELF